MESQLNKMMKIYGAGSLNHNQVQFIRELFKKLEDVGFYLESKNSQAKAQ